MKYFIVADVHGFYDELMKSLEENGFDRNNPDHAFVSLGDLMDRGRKPFECLQFVNSLDRKILVRGNHEDLLVDMLNRGYSLGHDLSNGTATTASILFSFMDKKANETVPYMDSVAKMPELCKYLDSLVDYAEVDDNIFVHGWIPSLRNDPCKYHARGVSYTFDPGWRLGDWDAARWVNGMDAWSQGVREPNKTIFCGHWHTSYGHARFEKDGVEFPNLRSTNPEHRRANFDPFVADGIVAMDGCTAYTRKVNCYVLDV